ncbi:MAG: hypothetical protein B1H03_02480 [Planctomycetales bacterium 4484_113]|nr:MAG: hypothetical protein B1H03_02480 [Planctomycetales bacterium 4484_113]
MLLHATIIVLLVLGGLIVAARLFEGSFIYFPTRHPSGRWDTSAFGIEPQDVWLTTSDGVRIHGWFLGGEDEPITLLYFHGNGGNITDRIEKLTLLRNLRASVFIIDYRGYGRSEGRPNEKGLYRDADAAYEYLTKERGTNAGSIVVYGASLGGAVAVDIASRKPVGGVILESTFTSARAMALKVLPVIPPALYLRTGFDSLEKIRKVRTPLLMIHGSDDTTVPTAMGRELFAAANEPKRFVEIAHAQHNDVFWVAREEYLRVIGIFLAELEGNAEPQQAGSSGQANET